MHYHTCRMDNGSGSRRLLPAYPLLRPPSKVHSTNPSILQSHRLQLSVKTRSKMYSSFSTVLQFMVNILPLYSLFVNLIFGIFQIFLLQILRDILKCLCVVRDVCHRRVDLICGCIDLFRRRCRLLRYGCNRLHTTYDRILVG